MHKVVFLLAICLTACARDKKVTGTPSIAQRSSTQQVFQPDTSIAGIFLLAHHIPDDLSIFSLDTSTSLPTVCFLHDDQYVKCVFHPGSSRNTFNAYEVGYRNDLSDSVKCYSLDLDKHVRLITETGVELGMSKNDLLALKGSSFSEQLGNSTSTVVSYKINDLKKSSFLKNYNMPSYFSRYYFKNDSLIKFEFGFNYE